MALQIGKILVRFGLLPFIGIVSGHASLALAHEFHWYPDKQLTSIAVNALGVLGVTPGNPANFTELAGWFLALAIALVVWGVGDYLFYRNGLSKFKKRTRFESVPEFDAAKAFRSSEKLAPPDIDGGRKLGGRWDSMQAVAWIVSRDDSGMNEIAAIEIVKDELNYTVKEAAQSLTLRRKLGLSDDLLIDEAAKEICVSARKGEIGARGRRKPNEETREIEAAEWVNISFQPYLGRLYPSNYRHTSAPIWYDVTFLEGEIKTRWPPLELVPIKDAATELHRLSDNVQKWSHKFKNDLKPSDYVATLIEYAHDKKEIALYGRVDDGFSLTKVPYKTPAEKQYEVFVEVFDKPLHEYKDLHVRKDDLPKLLTYFGAMQREPG